MGSLPDAEEEKTADHAKNDGLDRRWLQPELEKALSWKNEGSALDLRAARDVSTTLLKGFHLYNMHGS